MQGVVSRPLCGVALACLALGILVVFASCGNESPSERTAFLIDLGAGGERIEIPADRVADELPFELVIPSDLPEGFTLAEIEVLTSSGERSEIRDLMTHARLIFRGEDRAQWLEVRQRRVPFTLSQGTARDIELKNGVVGTINEGPAGLTGTTISWRTCDVSMLLSSPLPPPLAQNDLLAVARSTIDECE